MKKKMNSVRRLLQELVPERYIWRNNEDNFNYDTKNERFNPDDEARFNQIYKPNNGTVFNSGLSPDAFIDQTKLLYKGIQEFSEFSKEMINRFGEQVKPFLQDLWIQAKDLGKKFNADERGFLNLTLRKAQTQAGKDYKELKKKPLYYGNYSIWRGVGLAQLDVRAGEVIEVIRMGQRVKNSFEDRVLKNLRGANKVLKNINEQQVADAIWIGNETSRTFNATELAVADPITGRPALSPEQIQAYNFVRDSVNINLDIRRDTKLYALRERARRLNDRLSNFAPGTPEHTNILTQLLDVSDTINRVGIHFADLKSSGYISTKRQGPIAAYAEDATGKLYQQFDNFKDADEWVKQQELAGANPALSDIYDVRVPAKLRQAAAKLTPGQFEDLIDSAGLNPHAPEIEKLRDEVYSRFPSFGYELKRDFVRGYDRNWQFVLDSVTNQTETYANSFYSRVAGEQGIQSLDRTNLQTDNYDLYQVLQKYVDHEISSPERSGIAKVAGMTRKGVYLFQLGFDMMQLYLNAIAQPITQNYSYFARVSHNGISLKGIEPEKYFGQAAKLSFQVAQKALIGKGNVPIEFEQIRNRLISEGVITPEFNKALLELETEKTVSSRLKTKSVVNQVEHWAGVFMRAGEKTTRTHAAAEAYLVGKNKFNLAGEELINFIVRAVDATQTNPSRAEAPLLVRGSQNTGEIRKLLYQFNAFNHMWFENLMLNAKADFQARSIKSTSRHLGAVALMGGVTGLPLAGFAAGIYTALTGEDPRKKFKKLVGDNSFIERTALYGFTGSATISQRSSAGIPFVEDVAGELFLGEKSVPEIFSLSKIPAFSTAGQITKGFNDIRRGDTTRGFGQILPLRPARNVATAIRYNKEGIKTRKGITIVPKSKVTPSQKFLQVVPGISPSPLTEYYEKQNREKRTQVVKRLRKILQ